MAKTQSKTEVQTIKRMFMYLSAMAAILLLVLSGLAFWASSFIGTMVHDELAAQKVYFPEKGTPSFDAETYPDLQKYAGQLVDSPEKAEAYANGYIARHLSKTAEGKTYSEISTESMKDPSNEKLQAQKQSLFQGEMLRGILLTSGYGFGTIGKIAGIAAFILLVGSAILAIVAGWLRLQLR